MCTAIIEDNTTHCVRCRHSRSICSTEALSIFGKDPEESTLIAGNIPEARQVETLITGRHLVRLYEKKPVAPDTIVHLFAVVTLFHRCQRQAGEVNSGKIKELV